MGRKKKSNFLVSAHRTLRKKSVVAAVYIVLRLLVILMMVAQFFNGNFENVFLCILTLILFLLPTIFEKSLQIDLPNALEIIILLFIFAAEILGEIRAFYTTFAYWDTMLHTINGYLSAAIGFSLQPQQASLSVPLSGVHGHRGLLLLHDHRRAVGVF